MVIRKPLHRVRALPLCISLLTFALPTAHAATKWQDPTPEELTMTSQPQVPGAPAVILYREEIVDDTGGWSYYYRIKVLTDIGRDRYTNIAVEYPSRGWDDDYTITSIAARTIHADGTITPFTGKPFDRLLKSSSSENTRQKVFALPDVQVGSIIEYRYTVQLNTYGTSFYAFVPTFEVQTDLFARKEHFLWRTGRGHVDLTSTLPGGSAAVKIKGSDPQNFIIDLDNVLPIPDEPDMPPLSSLVQKVVFYTDIASDIHTPEAYWKFYGKSWSVNIEDFVGSTSKLTVASAAITAGATTPEDKLRRIYAAVQQLENTNFSRERSAHENKVNGIADAKSTLDILHQKRGDNHQLTILFVGLARAAGFNAYVMDVTNRDQGRFDPQFITFRQLDDYIAIVELNRQDLFLDPAEPLCPFGQLQWPHSHAGGLRQTADGVAFAVSASPLYKDSDTRRVATLTLDETGHQSGTVDIAFTGAPALLWRQTTLLGDETALHQDLEKYLLALLPKGSDVALTAIENLHDADKPLVAHFQVSGPLGTVTGKSAFVPAQLFQVNNTSPFPDTKRTLPIEFSYPESIHDAVSLRYPASWHIDTPPAAETDVIPKIIGCDFRVQSSPTAIILHRDFVLGALTIDPARYTELRAFYEKIATRDQATILFRTKPASTAAQ